MIKNHISIIAPEEIVKDCETCKDEKLKPLLLAFTEFFLLEKTANKEAASFIYKRNKVGYKASELIEYCNGILSVHSPKAFSDLGRFFETSTYCSFPGFSIYIYARYYLSMYVRFPYLFEDEEVFTFIQKLRLWCII